MPVHLRVKGVPPPRARILATGWGIPGSRFQILESTTNFVILGHRKYECESWGRNSSSVAGPAALGWFLGIGPGRVGRLGPRPGPPRRSRSWLVVWDRRSRASP